MSEPTPETMNRAVDLDTTAQPQSEPAADASPDAEQPAEAASKSSAAAGPPPNHVEIVAHGYSVIVRTADPLDEAGHAALILLRHAVALVPSSGPLESGGLGFAAERQATRPEPDAFLRRQALDRVSKQA